MLSKYERLQTRTCCTSSATHNRRHVALNYANFKYKYEELFIAHIDIYNLMLLLLLLFFFHIHYEL